MHLPREIRRFFIRLCMHWLTGSLAHFWCTMHSLTPDVPDSCQLIAFYRQQNYAAAEPKKQDASSKIWSGNLELVAVPLLLALAFRRLDADLLVVLLQRCKILTRLGELALFHALADVVMDEGTLRVHQVELAVNARHHLRNRGAVRDHAARTHDLRT